MCLPDLLIQVYIPEIGIVYYLINTKVLYIFDTQELREWVHKHKNELWQTCMGDFALGYIIPNTVTKMEERLKK